VYAGSRFRRSGNHICDTFIMEYFVEFCDRDFECIVETSDIFLLFPENGRGVALQVVAAIMQQRRRMRKERERGILERNSYWECQLYQSLSDSTRQMIGSLSQI
jgi:hypothetical protein